MPTPDVDLAPMRLAIAASRQALAAGDQPFGATLVSPAGQVLLTERNRQHTAADTSAHAETVLLRRAAEQLGPAALRGATVYAAAQPDMARVLGGPLLPARCADLLGAATPPVPVTGGVLADEALAVLQDAAAR